MSGLNCPLIRPKDEQRKGPKYGVVEDGGELGVTGRELEISPPAEDEDGRSGSEVAKPI